MIHTIDLRHEPDANEHNTGDFAKDLCYENDWHYKGHEFNNGILSIEYEESTDDNPAFYSIKL